MTRCKMVSGQLDMFDLMNSMAAVLEIMPVQEVPVAVCNPENYLMREEKILSLLRNKTRKDFRGSSFLDLFSQRKWENTTNRIGYLMGRIRKGLIRPLVESVSVWDDETEQRFRSLFCGYDAAFHFSEADATSTQFYREVTKSSSWCVLLHYGDRKVLLGGAKAPSKKWSFSRKLLYLMHCDCYGAVSDFEDFFATLLCVCQMKHYLEDYFAQMGDEEIADNVVYRRLKAIADAERDMVIQYGENHGGKVLVDTGLSECAFVAEMVREAGLVIEPVDARKEPAFMFSDLAVSFLLADEPKNKSNLPEPNAYGKSALTVSDEKLVKVLSIILDDYSEEKQAQVYHKALSESYAKSFMTKKGIPDHIVRAMELSGFNNTFGYVEFDEECDQVKLEDIYREFEALANYLGLSEHKEVSLRFRKLGQHKASGLYYPSLKCLCVDVRQPSSFAHELFHMLDYEHGELSRAWDFQKIKDLYKEEFDRIAKKRQISFSGKYNKDYFFQATEIFARCGEMYLTQVCQIDNSLVRPRMGSCEYPWTKELSAAVKEYFDAFLGLETHYDFAAWSEEYHEKGAS